LLRRTKAEVLAELPAKIEITYPVELSEAERNGYEALRQHALETFAQAPSKAQDPRFQILAEITRLRRFCCHPSIVIPDFPSEGSKLEAFGRIAADLVDNHHKALVFSQFVDVLTLARKVLDRAGISYQYLDGTTPVSERQKAVHAFQSGESDFFLISLKAGGFGLNLTAADYVIHLDPWWNPAVEDQATDRTHRIGQRRPVTVYRLVAVNTIEEKIVSLHAKKRALADSLLREGDSATRLKVDDLMELLSQV
jgi:SNF2 family DNA or RNA helicase